MFPFVSAFPKFLHCTDEAQQAETVLSAVLSIIFIIISIIINDGCHYVWHKAQTAILHYGLYSMAWTVVAGWR